MASELPFLALGPPRIAKGKGRPFPQPKLIRPSAGRQGDRVGPRFAELQLAFNAERIRREATGGTEVDPELVLVFDLVGTVNDLRKAIDKVEGLEFLAEHLEDDREPDDDFYYEEKGRRTTKPVSHSINVVVSNAKAAGQLVALWGKRHEATWNKGDTRGFTPLKTLFSQLVDLRRWGTQDRVRESGLLDSWREDIAVVGPQGGPVEVELELWYRNELSARQAAESRVRSIVEAARGSIVSRCEIPEIRYHAMLASIPRHLAEQALAQGAESIELLTAEQVMFASPHEPMSFGSDVDAAEMTAPAPSPPASGRPRVALLDGLPLANHDLLAGRLIVDDPDDLGSDYPAGARHHGTAMASLIIHGDLSSANQPMARPLYVRPILMPDSAGREGVQRGVLLTDLLHRAIRRIVEGEAGHEAAAPSVRVVNLSIGVPARALVRRISPAGRLLDWLSVKYNLLFIVSAGNHPVSLEMDAAQLGDDDASRAVALAYYVESSRTHGILPPGDAMNALTVGAIHADEATDLVLPGTVMDITKRGFPALYSATGPGVGRSVKPDILYNGGRQVFIRPPLPPGGEHAQVRLANSAARGPGNLVAAPLTTGGTTGQRFLYGTSNAAALVTREADHLFDVLESLASTDGYPYPDAQYHPVLVRALLVHSATWGSLPRDLEPFLSGDARKSKADLAHLLGYGVLDPDRAGSSAGHRAVLVGCGRLFQDDEAVFDVPLPPSLGSKAEWHQFTFTLATQALTVGGLNRYRVAKAYFDIPTERFTGGKRRNADFNAAKRGSCQHEVVAGRRAIPIHEGDTMPLHIHCRKDAKDLSATESIMFGLVVSVESAAETSTTVFAEIQRSLVQARARERVHVRPTDR
jgi:hypothetical protein